MSMCKSVQFKLISFLVPRFTWDIQADLSLVDNLPEGTLMMARGPLRSHSAAQGDYEAFQVARWALDCFVQPSVPFTHPGGRGSWDALPNYIRSTDEGWTYGYVFQRLLDIAALHPESRNLTIPNLDNKPLGVPAATHVATSTWRLGNQKLFSFCFRLHHALAGKVNSSSNHPIMNIAKPQAILEPNTETHPSKRLHVRAVPFLNLINNDAGSRARRNLATYRPTREFHSVFCCDECELSPMDS